MKRITILFCAFALSAALASCGEAPDGETAAPEETGLEAYLETVELPEHFFIDINASGMEWPETACVYSGTFLRLDAGAAAEAFLRGDIQSTSADAFGLRLTAENGTDRETLVLYDAGESCGVESGVDGGLSYLYDQGGECLSSKLTIVASYDDLFKMKYGYYQIDGFAQFADLSFAGCRDALDSVMAALSAVGFPSVAASKAYALDLETMEEQYGMYRDMINECNIELSDEEANLTFGLDDECYIFMLRQTIDGIPVVDVMWEKGSSNTAAANVMPFTYITVYYSKDGIVLIDARDLYTVAEDGGEARALVGPEHALRTLVEYYSAILLEYDTTVVSAELFFVGVPREDDYLLTPAWVFTLAKVSPYEIPDGPVYDRTDFMYYVVDALTGERIY